MSKDRPKIDPLATAASAPTLSAALKLIADLPERMDDFLDKWTRRMREAGYLSHTTAKREDCVLSFNGFMEPILTWARSGQDIPDFPALLGNPGDWTDFMIAEARRHRFRGVTAAMFLGCFKTFIASIEELIHETPASNEVRCLASRAIRRAADAAETIFMGDWSATSEREASLNLDETNRKLTLEKNKYENIFAITSDLVLILDADGCVSEANAAAKAFFGGPDLLGVGIWELLPIEGHDMTEVGRYYPPGQFQELALPGERLFFKFQILPLKLVSLASSGYMVLLTDISSHVLQRESLVKAVDEGNIALRKVMKTVESERAEIYSAITRKVETLFLPAIDRAARADNPKAYLDILRDQLVSLGREGSGDDGLALRLTPTEMRVCRLIQAGNSTKDIARSLNLSEETVQTHRKNIRKKLGLRGRDANLYTHLVAGDL